MLSSFSVSGYQIGEVSKLVWLMGLQEAAGKYACRVCVLPVNIVRFKLQYKIMNPLKMASFFERRVMLINICHK